MFRLLSARSVILIDVVVLLEISADRVVVIPA